MSGGDRTSTTADRATRRLARSEFERPMVVEAGAGTGKTALLVARVAAWCVGPGWERHAGSADSRDEVARRVVQRVTAITFTEAAAAQMAREIAAALLGLSRARAPVGWTEAEGGPEPVISPEIAGRAGILAEEVHRMPVSTIHAFCQRLLTARPLEAGLHPGFTVDADGSMLEQVVAEVMEEALRGVARGEGTAGWEVLASRGTGPQEVAQALRGLVDEGVGAAELEQDPYHEVAVARIASELRQALGRLVSAEGGRLETVPRSARSVEVRGRFIGLAHAVEALGRAPALADILAAVEAQDISSDDLKRLGKWSRHELTQGEEGRLGDASTAFQEASGAVHRILAWLVAVDPGGLAAARQVLAPLLAEVERRRRSRGVVTFADLLRRTRLLLEASPDARRQVRAEMDQLLVDEFQDTDWVQCRIVESLGLGGTEPPGLFVVGDPKQSIYAWRSADLAAYDAFLERIRESGGVVVPLTRNFRSHQPILDEVARVVAPVMQRRTGVQPAFEGLEATGARRGSPGFDRPPFAAVEYWVTWPRGDGGAPAPPARSSDATALEAEAMARDILRLHREAGVRWGEVGVLLRKTTQQEVILESLRRHRIPFDVARERSYFRQREVVEIAAVVRHLVEPADVLAMLTVLRSDVVGLPDAVLAPLFDAGLPAAMARLGGGDPRAEAAAVERCVEGSLSAVDAATPGLDAVPGWRCALIGACEILAELRRSLREDSPDVFVEALRSLWLAEVSAAARELGPFRVARLERFFSDLETSLADPAAGEASLARLLRRSVEEGQGSGQGAEPDLELDAVHVMTIHGVKGLGFEHVYVPQVHLGEGTGPRRAPVEVARGGGGLEYRLFGWPTPGWAEAEERRLEQGRAERVRLLYVAMTRAKSRLVVSGSWCAESRRVDPSEAGSFADLLARSADDERLQDQVRDGAERVRDPGNLHVQWVLPALAAPRPEVGTAEPDEAVAGVALEDARSEVEGLQRSRADAARRMVRPYSGTASEESHRAIETAGEEGGHPVGAAVDRSAATAAGSAVHRVLEHLDLGGDLSEQLLSAAQGVEMLLETGDPAEAVSICREQLERLAEGRLVDRLAELGPQVLARELPVLLPAPGGGPVGFLAGSVDLVYADPGVGRIVVVDFKTDRVEEDDRVAARAVAYRPQLETYARALQDALGLEAAPRKELWFLWPDEVVAWD